MTPINSLLRETLADAERNLKHLQNRVANMEMNCHHKFPKEAKYDPIYEESYTIPGDAPGTMGIDWRGPSYVPSKTTPRWTRTCTVCGKKETTTATQEVVTKQPHW